MIGEAGISHLLAIDKNLFRRENAGEDELESAAIVNAVVCSFACGYGDFHV